MTCAAVLVNCRMDLRRHVGSLDLHRRHTTRDASGSVDRDLEARRHRLMVQRQSVSWAGLLNGFRLLHTVRRR